MGFKFGYFKFSIGIVEIEMQNVDTDAYKGTINFTIPTEKGEFTLHLYSGSNWSSSSFSCKVGFEQPKKPEPLEEIEEPNWEEDGDSNSDDA
jgi:hypothetical protein